jgi:hypothetical protein
LGRVGSVSAVNGCRSIGGEFNFGVAVLVDTEILPIPIMPIVDR